MNPWLGKKVAVMDLTNGEVIPAIIDNTNGECIVFQAEKGHVYSIDVL